MIPKVMIGCPLRNRAWILPRYLRALEKMDYPAHKREYCFIINNSCDATEKILRDFAAKTSVPVRLVIYDLPNHGGHRRGAYKFTHLAILRNRLLEEFIRTDCEYLFSIDSDILVPEYALRYLINAECDIISALVCNGHQIGNDQIFNLLNKNDKGQYVYVTGFPRDRIFTVDYTGAACLINKKVVKDYGVCYSAEFGAEDIGFCETARRKGIKIYCDPRVECEHIMDET